MCEYGETSPVRRRRPFSLRRPDADATKRKCQCHVRKAFQCAVAMPIERRQISNLNLHRQARRNSLLIGRVPGVWMAASTGLSARNRAWPAARRTTGWSGTERTRRSRSPAERVPVRLAHDGHSALRVESRGVFVTDDGGYSAMASDCNVNCARTGPSSRPTSTA